MGLDDSLEYLFSPSVVLIYSLLSRKLARNSAGARRTEVPANSPSLLPGALRRLRLRRCGGADPDPEAQGCLWGSLRNFAGGGPAPQPRCAGAARCGGCWGARTHRVSARQQKKNRGLIPAAVSTSFCAFVCAWTAGCKTPHTPHTKIRVYTAQPGLRSLSSPLPAAFASELVCPARY